MNKREAEQLLGDEFLQMYDMASEAGRERLRSQLSERELLALDTWAAEDCSEAEPLPDVGQFIRLREARRRGPREPRVEFKIEGRLSDEAMDALWLDEQQELEALVPMPPARADPLLPWYGWAALIVLAVIAVRLLTAG